MSGLIARAMKPDLMAADESSLAADAELTRVREPRDAPALKKETVLAKGTGCQFITPARY